MVSMEYQVWTKMISLVATILHRREEEVAMGWEGLTKKAEELCDMVGLASVLKKYFHRKEIKQAMSFHHEMNLKD